MAASALEVVDFTGDGEVYAIIQQLKNDPQIQSAVYSDVIDQAGHQYVDLVQEGGGMWGLALLGYTYVLEEVGFRFFSLAGTSAGAINALLLAAAPGPMNQPKTPWILKHLIDQDLSQFVDGPPRIQRLLETLLKQKSGRLRLAWHVIRCYKYLNRHLGCNPGHVFHQWLRNLLSAADIRTTADLQQHRSPPDDLHLRNTDRKLPEDLTPRLAFVATDITTETRVQFPEMALMYWQHPERVNPADYVRASMSIPGFFHPYRVPVGANRSDNDVLKAWFEDVGYTGRIPSEAVFADGGVVSNFPIDVLVNKNRVPRLPTFGVKLGADRNEAKKTTNLLSYIRNIFDAARHVHDYEFLFQNPDHRPLIKHIFVDEFDWLNFEMSSAQKIALFKKGARAAKNFLYAFDWKSYKETRAKRVSYQEAVAEDKVATDLSQPV